MPTTSQCQILKTVIEKSGNPTPIKSNIVAKLETFDLKDDEEDMYGLKKLKTTFHDAAEKRGVTPGKDVAAFGQKKEDATKTNDRILPVLPKQIRCSLYRLGFRNSEINIKKTVTQLAEYTLQESEAPDMDDVIKRLMDNHPGVPKKPVKPPGLKPLAVCFNYPGSDLTHLEVKKAMDGILIPYPEVKMLTIEFQPRLKLLRPDKTENTCRWVITFSSEWGRNRMNGKHFLIRDVSTILKRYDDTVNLEYKHYSRMVDLMRVVNND